MSAASTVTTRFGRRTTVAGAGLIAALGAAVLVTEIIEAVGRCKSDGSILLGAALAAPIDFEALNSDVSHALQ